MQNIVFREAVPSDFSSLAELRAVNSATQEHWMHRIDQYWRGLVNPQQALPPRVIYVAVEDNTIIGFIACHLTRRFGCDGELEWIDVLQSRRGAGVGSQLVLLLNRWFINNKAYRICVDPGNELARSFYYKNGATALNEHWLFWSDISTLPGM